MSVWAAGGVAVPLCTSHPAREMAYVVKDSGAGVVLGSERFKQKVEEVVEIVKEEGNTVPVGSIEKHQNTNADADITLSGSWEEWKTRRALMIYTSGTTNLPVSPTGFLNNIPR